MHATVATVFRPSLIFAALLGLWIAAVPVLAATPEVGLAEVSADAGLAAADKTMLIEHLRQLDRSSGYQCFRNVSNYEDPELLSKVVSSRRYYREQAAGEIYASAYLASTFPPAHIGFPMTSKWTKHGNDEFVLEYDRETTVLGQMKEISNTVHAFRRSGLVRHVFRVENGQLQWIRASYDVNPWHGQPGAARPHVRCARIVSVKGRWFGTNTVLEPLVDIRLDGGTCRGSGSQCAEEVREPRYLK